MSATAEKTSKSASARQDYTVFKLDNRSGRKSGFTRRDTINTAKPKVIDTCARFDLPITSRHHLGEGKGFVKTQYIPGANTIYVDNFVDAEGKIQKGLKEQGYDLRGEYERAVSKGIHFQAGLLDLKKYGDDPMLVEFVNKHENNQDSSAGRSKDRTINRMFSFAPLKAEETATKDTASFEDKLTGMNLVGSLRKPEGNGSYTYDQHKIDAVVHILDMPAIFGQGDVAQKFKAILDWATADPAKFSNVISAGMSDVQMIIGKATALQLLGISSKEVKFRKGADAPWAKVYEFAGKLTEEEQTTALTLYFIGDAAGRVAYNSIRAEVETTLQK